MPAILTGSRPTLAALALAAAVLAIGCSTLQPQFIRDIAPGMRVGAADRTFATVSADTAVGLQDYDGARIKMMLESALLTRKAARPGIPNREVLVDVRITRYEKGNPAGRSMFTGTGPMHIEGRVEVYAMPGKQLIGAFTLADNFPWGGSNGGMYRGIEAVEQSFADGVAAAVTNGGSVTK